MRGELDGSAPQEAEEDAARWGIDLPEGWGERQLQDGIWEEHVPALVAFLAVSGQWRTRPHGMGETRWIGLDYAAVGAGFGFAGITMTPEVWADLRLIEAGALDELNKDR